MFSVGVTAMLILSCCPIAAFSSQKFWIDNCLLLSVTLCVAVHVVLLHLDHTQLCTTHSKGKPTINWYDVNSVCRHALSGVIFGLVGLNCKITAAALLLFLVGWSFLQQYLLYQAYYTVMLAKTNTTGRNKSTNLELHSNTVFSRKHTSLLRHAVGDAIVNCIVFGLCALLAYAPWMYIYWVRSSM